MNLFRKKSPWERLVGPVSDVAPRAAKSGLTALGAVAGLSLASAAVSKARARWGSE
ncbi:MAG TPA: hypothetical protein VH419_15355 [Nocardioidaceae bacterium]|jgi:hypothetical protein